MSEWCNEAEFCDNMSVLAGKKLTSRCLPPYEWTSTRLSLRASHPSSLQKNWQQKVTDSRSRRKWRNEQMKMWKGEPRTKKPRHWHGLQTSNIESPRFRDVLYCLSWGVCLVKRQPLHMGICSICKWKADLGAFGILQRAAKLNFRLSLRQEWPLEAWRSSKFKEMKILNEISSGTVPSHCGKRCTHQVLALRLCKCAHWTIPCYWLRSRYAQL